MTTFISKILNLKLRFSTRIEMLFLVKMIVLLIGFSSYSNSKTTGVLLNPLEDGKYIWNTQNVVSGKVLDGNGEPLAGANILEKGTVNGTQADFDGNFSLTVANSNAVLVVSYIGFVAQDIVLDNRTNITVTLETDTSTLDEVVVIGYGTVKKSDLTGSVASIKVDDMSQGVVTSVDQLISGKSAGVNVVQGSGEPGAGFAINIRGASSINASNGPLYVIDGMPIDNSKPITQNGVGIGNSRTPRSPLASLNPGDIASIEILKDASATAIYGSRGANGVVLITTKSGSKGETEFSYSGYSGVQNWHNELDLLDANEYKTVLNEIIAAGGADPSLIIGDDIANTNWQDVIQNKNAVVHSHQFSVSGGTQKLNYFASFNVMEQDGIVKNSFFKRYGGRVNLNSKLTDKLTLGLKLTHNNTRDSFVPNGGASIDNSGALQAAYTYDPTIPIFDDEGKYARNELISVDNPLALINGVNSKSKTNFTLVSTSLQYDINKEFMAKLGFGRDYSNEIRESFVSDIAREGQQANGVGNMQTAEKSHILFDGTINYTKALGENNLNALLGASYERYEIDRSSISSSDFPSLILGANNLGLSTRDNYNLSNSKSSNSLASLFGRVNYTFNNKYLLTGTARLDGSSRFGSNNKYGIFPSAAFAWKLGEEEFIASSETIDDLKLRVSWGQSGNQEISNYAALSTYGRGQFAVFDDNAVTTTSPTRIPNPDLKWETTEQFNIGLDYGLWNNRVTGNLDFYVKNTSDLLIQIPVPSSTGFSTQLGNIGKIRNSGFEFSLNTYNISSENFNWSSALSLSTIKNEVLSLGPIPEIISSGSLSWVGGDAILTPGEPMYSFIGWEVDGVWQLDDDFSTTTDNVSPGDIKFRDQNGDGAVNADDRVILGNSFPDIQFSLTNTFSLGNFELFVFIDGMSGMEMMNTKLIESYYPINFRRNKYAEPYLNRWTPENPTNAYPSFVNPTNQGVKAVNSYTIEDASYAKLRTVRLSYDLGKVFDIRSAQIYITGENLYTLTNYSGIDPALNPNGNANYRIDLNAYPSATTIMLGVNLDL
jgi:TonB-linked SusC/RagA family outer membrane protein